MAQGIHRVTANSKRGRQMISPGVIFDSMKQSMIHKSWNERVELEKKAKKAAKQGKGNYLAPAK